MINSLFQLIPQEHLADILNTLHEYTCLPIQLTDSLGTSILAFGEMNHYCSLIQKQVFSAEACQTLYAKAGKRAQHLGSAYIFSCHAHLNRIAFPILHGRELLGCILIGPFLLDQPDSTLISGISSSAAISPALALDLYDELHGIPIIAPDKVTLLSKLVSYLLSPLLSSAQATLMVNQERLAQQSRINETIQLYKTQNPPDSHDFFYEKETALLSSVKTGNIQESNTLLNELLGYALFCEGGNIESIRLRAIELTALLSRVAVEGGAGSEGIYDLSLRFITQLSRQQDFAEISILLQDVIDGFITSMFHNIDKGNHHIRKALQYISTHYAQSLSAADVAKVVNLSPHYFSTLFSETVGESFHCYLMRIRVEASKRLLLSTDDSLTKIAIAMGFSDQSYYCKVFSKIVGMTPGKYRNGSLKPSHN